MGLDTPLLNFYGLTLIHLIDPLSQVVQTVNVCYAIYIYIYIYKKKARWLSYSVMFLFGTEKRLYEWTLQSTFFWVLKGKSQLNPRLLSFTNGGHFWTSDEHRNDFLWNQSRSAFLNSQFILLYALMSFMRSWLWFKFFNSHPKWVRAENSQSIHTSNILQVNESTLRTFSICSSIENFEIFYK